jgi:DNA-binding transcriptional LysR family regulator
VVAKLVIQRTVPACESQVQKNDQSCSGAMTPDGRRAKTLLARGACASAGFTPRVAFETADYAATASMVRHGFAIAVVPRLAWPADTHGVAGGPCAARAAATLARHILLAQRTGRTPALIAELRHHLTRSWPQQR